MDDGYRTGEGPGQRELADPVESVRVVHFLDQEIGPQRSRAETHRDNILTEALEALEKGRDLVNEGLSIFAVLEEPQHQDLGIKMNQVIEQVIEYRRMKQ